MTAQSGRGFLVRIGDGATPETFATIAGMRATSLVVNSDAVDITNKDSGGWRELLGGAGVRRVAVSGSGVFTDSAAEATLRGKALAGALGTYEIVFENGDRLAGTFLVATLDYSGDHNGERTYTLALESSGAIVFTAAV